MNKEEMLERWKLKTKAIFHKITYDEFWFYIDDLMKENIELENIRKEAFEYITNTIIPYGDEWHWDDSSIRDYIVELLTILQNWR